MRATLVPRTGADALLRAHLRPYQGAMKRKLADTKQSRALIARACTHTHTHTNGCTCNHGWRVCTPNDVMHWRQECLLRV